MNFSDYLQQHHDIRKDFNYPHSSPGCVLQLTIHAFSLLSQMISLFCMSFPRYVSSCPSCSFVFSFQIAIQSGKQCADSQVRLDLQQTFVLQLTQVHISLHGKCCENVLILSHTICKSTFFYLDFTCVTISHVSLPQNISAFQFSGQTALV